MKHKLSDLKPAIEILSKHRSDDFLSSCNPDVDIGLVYRKEVNEIKSIRALRKHISRWSVLFKLENSRLDKKVLRRFNERLVLRRLLNIDAKNANGEIFDIACNIALPFPLVRAFLISKHYNVSPNLALVQLYNHGGPEFF